MGGAEAGITGVAHATVIMPKSEKDDDDAEGDTEDQD